MDKLHSLFKPKEKGAAHRAGEKIDRATQQVKEKAERGVDKAADKVIEAGNKIKRAVRLEASRWLV